MRGNCVVTTQGGHLEVMDMEEALQMTKDFDMGRYRILEALTNNCGRL